MTDLIIRPSGITERPWSLQLRWHGPAETTYQTLWRGGEETAREIIDAGATTWLFGDPAGTSMHDARMPRVAGVIVPSEPTQAMMDAFHGESWPGRPVISPLSQAGRSFARSYRAMLSAVPIHDVSQDDLTLAGTSSLPTGEARSSSEAGGLDPRLVEWGYGSLEEAICHLGELIEDQAAFDGLGEAVTP